MTIWRADYITGRFPPLRIAWNLVWVVPVIVTGLIFLLFVGILAGPSEAKDMYDRI